MNIPVFGMKSMISGGSGHLEDTLHNMYSLHSFMTWFHAEKHSSAVNMITFLLGHRRPFDMHFATSFVHCFMCGICILYYFKYFWLWRTVWKSITNKNVLLDPNIQFHFISDFRLRRGSLSSFFLFFSSNRISFLLQESPFFHIILFMFHSFQNSIFLPSLLNSSGLSVLLMLQWWSACCFTQRSDNVLSTSVTSTHDQMQCVLTQTSHTLTNTLCVACSM